MSNEKRVGGLVGLRTLLRPGTEDVYEADATIWPEVQAAQMEAGIRRWTIFRHGLELFHVVDCDDFERAQALLADNPVDQGQDDPDVVVDRLQLIYDGDNHH